MRRWLYLKDVVTLELDRKKCTGCGMCIQVCPHAVLSLTHGRTRIENRDACMECGACATNCPSNAITVTPGVGCAAYIIQTWYKGKDAAACGNVDCC